MGYSLWGCRESGMMERATRRQETSLGLYALQTKACCPEGPVSPLGHLAHGPTFLVSSRGPLTTKRRLFPSVTEKLFPNLGSPDSSHQDRNSFPPNRTGCDPGVEGRRACRQVLRPRSHEVGVPRDVGYFRVLMVLLLRWGQQLLCGRHVARAHANQMAAVEG